MKHLPSTVGGIMPAPHHKICVHLELQNVKLFGIRDSADVMKIRIFELISSWIREEPKSNDTVLIKTVRRRHREWDDIKTEPWDAEMFLQAKEFQRLLASTFGGLVLVV